MLAPAFSWLVFRYLCSVPAGRRVRVDRSTLVSHVARARRASKCLPKCWNRGVGMGTRQTLQRPARIYRGGWEGAPESGAVRVGGHWLVVGRRGSTWVAVPRWRCKLRFARQWRHCQRLRVASCLPALGPVRLTWNGCPGMVPAGLTDLFVLV